LVDAGRGVRFAATFEGQTYPAFAVRYRGQVQAFVNRCAHIGVELDWSEGEFFDASGLYLICATHGATYFPDSGGCAGGPCSGRGLAVVPVVEIDRKVYLIEA
jgi:nitrite reductase/ring-hydroxylating ferredoxin subunit